MAMLTSLTHYGGSPRVPVADGMLSCLGGFSPRQPAGGVPPSPRMDTIQNSPNGLDLDLAHLKHDPEGAAKIMRRRQRERDRTNGLLTPRIRQTGLDIVALNSQVASKRAVHAASLQEDLEFQQALALKGKICDAAEAEIQESARQKHKACKDFSLANLRQEQRREWSLSDPHLIRREQPARRDGYEVPVCSIQKFESEDRPSPSEMKARRQEQASWLLAQMAEKKLREEAVREMDRIDDQTLLRGNHLRGVLEDSVKDEQKDEVMATARENQQLASARSARRQAVRAREQAAEEQHTTQEREHCLTREKYDFDVGTDGKRRDYKRCAYEEEQAMWDANAALLRQKVLDRQSQRHVSDEYVKITNAVDALGKMAEIDFAKQNIRRRQQFDAANAVLAQEQKQRALDEKAAYTSFASP